MISIGPKFSARWEGSCARCDEDWEAGDDIGYVEDVVVCLKCYDEAQRRNEWSRQDDR